MQDNHDPNPPGAGGPMEDDEEVIELTRIVAVSPGAAALPRLPLAAHDTKDAGQDEEACPDISRLAAEIVGDKDRGDTNPQGAGPSRSVTLPLDQLEQALEKVVKKLYSGSIESMVLDVIEKHVIREIGKITALIADAAGKGK